MQAVVGDPAASIYHSIGQVQLADLDLQMQLFCMADMGRNEWDEMQRKRSALSDLSPSSPDTPRSMLISHDANNGKTAKCRKVPRAAWVDQPRAETKIQGRIEVPLTPVLPKPAICSLRKYPGPCTIPQGHPDWAAVLNKLRGVGLASRLLSIPICLPPGFPGFAQCPCRRNCIPASGRLMKLARMRL